MSNCTGAPAQQWLEAYLQGTLPKAQALRFEEHYFECPVCLAQAEALGTVTQKLGRQPKKAPGKIVAWPARAAALGAIAALLVLGFFGIREFRKLAQPGVAGGVPTAATRPSVSAQHSNAPVQISQLADLTLLPYHAPSLRGLGEDPHFASGMTAYGAQDCPRALKALAQVPAGNEDASAARFYSGVCSANLGDFRAAEEQLRSVASASGSGLEEQALYYMAQIALARNDAAAARDTLTRTIALHGDIEQRARAQLASIPTGAH